jgi:catechol 2,3-dioxygenase-like lactoylglutathione lyase family enzyme
MLTALNHITLAVKDIDKSFKFYKNILGLTPLVKWNKGAYFLVGDKTNGFWFCLNQDDSRITNECYTHYAFSMSKDHFEKMRKKIINSGTEIFKNNTSPGESLYFLDPDEHKLEIHTGDWCDRINAKKLDLGSWKNVEWFE